jgi:hypothetical protein
LFLLLELFIDLIIGLIPFPTGMEYKEEEITGIHIIIAIFSFFSIALGNSSSLDAHNIPFTRREIITVRGQSYFSRLSLSC